MPFKSTFKDLKDQFDRVLDVLDPPRQNNQQPPVPYGSRPGQYGPYPPPVPQNSYPYHPPPVPYNSHPYQGGPGGPAPPPYTASEQSTPPYWAPVFSPEIPLSVHFDYDLGGGGWGNKELQTYTSFPTNSFHSPNRTLILRAIINSSYPADRDKYTSARLLSKQRLSRRRGYVSAVLAPPSAEGIWPAFWLLPEEPFTWPTDGEVDIFEAWNGGLQNHSCLHWGNYTSPDDKKKHRVANTHLPGITQPHEYGFAWEQPEWGTEGGKLIWYVDGKAVMKCDKPPGTRRLEGWRILLNIAVGGTVCNGRKPRDGSYQLEVFALTMKDDPPGGWHRFEEDWNEAYDGRPLD